MPDMRFLHPEIVWRLVALLAAAMLLRAVSRRRLGLAATTRWSFERSSRASLLRRVPAVVFLAGLVLLGCALMEPVLPLAEGEIRSHVVAGHWSTGRCPTIVNRKSPFTP